MPEMPAAEALRSLVRPVYLPTVASGIATGMLVPVLPLYLREQGLSFSTVSAVLAAAGLGAILGGLPAGALLTRRRERQVVVIALMVMAITAAGLGVTTATLALLAFRLTFGMALVAFRLSVQTLVTRTVTIGVRGRALAYVGGSMRMALFVGPLLGGLLVDQTGFETTFAVSGAVAAAGLVGVLGSGAEIGGQGEPASTRPRLIESLWRHRRRLLVGGIAPALVMTAREGRFVVLPLIASDLGLSAAAVGALVAIGTGADLALFPVAGHLMDRHGRLFAMVPAFSLFGIGLALLAIAESAAMVGVAGVVIGVGNGLSSGTLLTLGSDLAPTEAPAAFLAGLAAMSNMGRVLGPLVVGVTADAVGLGGSALVLAVVMFVAIGYLIVVIGETRTDHSRVIESPASPGIS